MLNHLYKNRRRPAQKTCRALVLSPTRELSAQIADSFRGYGRHIRPLCIELAIGGVPINRQVRALARGAEVLVATPGRLLDLVHSRALRLDQVEMLVLDEADRMLDMGCIHDIKKVVAMLPKARQTFFFSATMPQQIVQLAEQMLREPTHVAVTPQATTAERIAQRVIFTERASKPALLAEVLRNETINRVLVFTRTKHGADKVVRALNKGGIAAEAIHGNKSQNQRERVLSAFRSGGLRTLIATDIAARGIDVDGISHVVNYDLPNIPESYVHRIGRTARAGAEGIAISFCDHEERAYLRDIEKLIQMTLPATDRRSNPKQDRQPAQHHRPQQARGQQQKNRRGQQKRGGHQQNRGGHQQNRGGHQQNDGGHRQNGGGQPPRFGKQPHRNDTVRQEPPRHADQGTPASEIGQVAFMRHAPRKAFEAGDATRGT